MKDLIASHRVNEQLIHLSRGLLQYVGESWPWSGADEAAEKDTVDRLVEEQRRSAGRLVDMLTSRGHIIDYGTYPTEYTSLHFVALDYLLDQLYAEQRVLADECDRDGGPCAGTSRSGSDNTAGGKSAMRLRGISRNLRSW